MVNNIVPNCTCAKLFEALPLHCSRYMHCPPCFPRPGRSHMLLQALPHPLACGRMRPNVGSQSNFHRSEQLSRFRGAQCANLVYLDQSSVSQMNRKLHHPTAGDLRRPGHQRSDAAAYIAEVLRLVPFQPALFCSDQAVLGADATRAGENLAKIDIADILSNSKELVPLASQQSPDLADLSRFRQRQRHGSSARGS